MSRALQKYLDHIMVYANRNEKDTAQIRKELEDHLLKKVSDLQAGGLTREDAVFQAIEDHGSARTVGYRLRKGFSLLDVRTEGTARGFVAIGPRAIGIIAFGNFAFGLFALGNFALGVFAFGALTIAGLLSVGGISLAPLGAAVGLAAAGRAAFGMIACGGLALGLQVPWAIDGVNLLSGENGIQFLQHFQTQEGTVALIAITLWLFLAVPVLNGLMCSIKKNEYLRIQKADPKLIE